MDGRRKELWDSEEKKKKKIAGFPEEGISVQKKW